MPIKNSQCAAGNKDPPSRKYFRHDGNPCPYPGYAPPAYRSFKPHAGKNYHRNPACSFGGGNTPLQVEMELMQTQSHRPTHTPKEHMLAFYKTFDELKEQNFDGMIITGAPVELLDFEEVEYWEELCAIMEWSKTHVYSTFHICWGAQAGLYYHYGIPKYPLPEKIIWCFSPPG